MGERGEPGSEGGVDEEHVSLGGESVEEGHDNNESSPGPEGMSAGKRPPPTTPGNKYKLNMPKRVASEVGQTPDSVPASSEVEDGAGKIDSEATGMRSKIEEGLEKAW